MTRFGAVLGIATTLAACSCQPDAPGNAVAGAGDGAANAIGGGDAAPAAPASGAPAPAAGGLSAEVSVLTGDVSDLNVRVTELGTVVDLPSDALFEFDKAELTPAATTALRKAAELIRRGAPGPIQVVGHTDSKGDDAYNQRLSEARAQSVAAWFGQEVGVRQRSFLVTGKGETAPIAANARPDGSDDPEGRARNRRVEVVIPRADQG